VYYNIEIITRATLQTATPIAAAPIIISGISKLSYIICIIIKNIYYNIIFNSIL
jgi:hypothetical protein